MSTSLPTGTVTFLFSDIEGSTRLWEQQPEEMRTTLADHDELLRRSVEAAGGRVLKHTGDGMVAVFPSAGQALDAAIDGQVRIGAHEFAVAELRVRMALHTGVADEREGDYFGPTLNRTARLLAAGHGGQVLVSAVTSQLLEDGLPEGVRLLDLGPHRLRDLHREERVFCVEGAGLPGGFPPLRTPDLVPNNLPLQSSSFVGRDQELAEVEKLLTGSRLVTLTGVGGAGKSRLALQVAAGLVDEYPDGVWLVELAPLADPALTTDTVAAVLGVPEQAGDRGEALVRHLRGKRVLLLLDNCEHLVEEAAVLAGVLLSQATAVRILATSRELLGVPGEVAYPVRSLQLPSQTEGLEWSELLRFDAVRLFVERAEAARPGQPLSPAEGPVVAEICRRLDALPLALELAAARLRTFSPRQIVDHLDHRFRLLTGGSRTALPRQQTLEATIGWSYELLDPEEQALFRRLSVFVGGFSLEAGLAVCGGEGLDDLAVLDLLPRLVDKSLVVAESGALDVRYRQLETLRQYGRERLVEAGESELLRSRHAAHYLALAEEAEPFLRGSKEREWWDRLEGELDNIRQAIAWGLEAGALEMAMRIAGAIWRFWWFRWRVSEGRALVSSILAMPGEVPERVRAKALLGAGTLAAEQGDPAAVSLLEESVAIYEKLYEEARAGGEDLQGRFHGELAAVFINLGVAYDRLGRYDKCDALGERALELAREIGDLAAVAVASGNQGETAARLGDLERARERFRESIAISRELGSHHRLVDALAQYSWFERALGDPRVAVECFGEAIRLAEEGGLATYRAVCTAELAVTRAMTGEMEGTLDDFLVAARRAVSDPEFTSTPSLISLVAGRGHLELLGGNAREAAELLGAVDRLLEERQVRDWICGLERHQLAEQTEEALGEAEYGEAHRAGRMLSDEEVVERVAAAVPGPTRVEPPD